MHGSIATGSFSGKETYMVKVPYLVVVVVVVVVLEVYKRETRQIRRTVSHKLKRTPL